MALSRMTEEIGRVLGGRYRIIAPIGRGASAQVFLADDVRLRRRVAVKMLHPALADDVEFSRRFQAEAQAAAALNHPHVMAVFDWGHDDGIPYLVLEYLSGGSLRGALDGGYRLTPSQALLVGVEAGRGLEYAHGRGLVHRDIKPANLLFGDEARLRIADFGLARALAEAAWTEPQGAVLGTARYASPEQAQGRALTGTADVYSLALVLVEAVTGQVPFAGDTTLGTLMARIDRPLPVSGELGPLRPVLERAGHPDPEQRLDAHDLVRALFAAAHDLPMPSPLPLAGAVAGAWLEDDPDPTMVGESRDDDLDVPSFMAAGAAGPLPVFHEDLTVEVAGAVVDDAAGGRDPAMAEAVVGPTSVAPVEPPPPSRSEEPPPGRRRRRWPWLVLIVVLLAGIGAGAGAIVAATRTPTHLVPSVVGLDVAAARAKLAPLRWQVAEDHTRKDGAEAGTVIEVEPVTGTRLEEGDDVTLVISDGNTATSVPSGLAGKPQAEAEQAIKDRGLVPKVTREYDEDVDEGKVIRLGDNTPTTLYKGATVGLIVSMGPRPRVVPDGLVGMTEAEATAALARVQLGVQTFGRYSDTVPAGVVLVISPGSGAEVARDSIVDLAVSVGPKLVAVPSIRGAKSLPEAVALLEAAGLQVGQVRGPAQGSPAGTDPAGGTKVRENTVVDIILARGKDG